MGKTDFLGCGFSFPLNEVNGTVAMASDEIDISESIVIILGTAKGERIMLPEFGSDLNELVFSPNGPSTWSHAERYAKECLDIWEPRISDISATAAADKFNKSKINISINYTIREKNTPANLVYPFYLNS